MPPAGFVDQGIHLDHPDVVTARAATRTWSTILNSDTCPEVEAALRAWADPGTVRPANNGVERCYWSAARHGHEVDLNVLATRSGPMATVSLRLAG